MRTFAVYQLGRNPTLAYNLAVQEARYKFGYARYTGSIAEKDGFVYCGEINSRHLDRMERYLAKGAEWHFSTRKGKAALPAVPKMIQKAIAKAGPFYSQLEGPAVCFRIVGYKAREIKAARGRLGSWDKVYAFYGTAPTETWRDQQEAHQMKLGESPGGQVQGH